MVTNQFRSETGISGLALYFPPLRVRLEDWCEWTGNSWDKISAVVGESFRWPTPREDAYTMAANAVLELIDRFEIDPGNVGFLGLGTESSKDNSAGAIIVKGMVNKALESHGQSRLSRHCEVPEFKHACLGGIYGLKAALRYVASDGADRQAIVVASDIAEYERHSSGEPTQGAGAVAMLVERDPQLLEIDLMHSGRASDYRGPDFRKPIARHFLGGDTRNKGSFRDFPVFSGKYSTFAYLDQTYHALKEMWQRFDISGLDYVDRVQGMFFHRPYQLMPVQALAFLYVRALVDLPQGAGELAELCKQAGVCEEELRAEARATPDLYRHVVMDGLSESSPYPATSILAGHVRKTEKMRRLIEEKLSLGAAQARDFGNLYTASLPAWMAAGMEAALHASEDITGHELVAVGYGSGDAAEAIPMRVAKGWRNAAERIGLTKALEGAVDLTREQYEALHDGREVPVLAHLPLSGFVVSHVGQTRTAAFQDFGVDYYAISIKETAP